MHRPVLRRCASFQVEYGKGLASTICTDTGTSVRIACSCTLLSIAVHHPVIARSTLGSPSFKASCTACCCTLSLLLAFCCCAALRCLVFRRIVLHCIVHDSVSLHCVLLCSAALLCVVHYIIALHCIVHDCVALHRVVTLVSGKWSTSA